jgi:heptosyltransferase-3
MSKPPKSYLIVCFRFIGDVLITTPLLLSIKQTEPDAVVDYLVFKGTEKVLVKNPAIRNIYTVEKGTSGIGVLFSLFKKYDVAIAANASDRNTIAAALTGKYSIGLTNGWKKEWWKGLILSMHYVCYDRIHAVHNVLMPLRMLGVEPSSCVSMEYDKDDRKFAEENLPDGKYILMHPYSMKSFKYWTAENWGLLAGLISKHTDCIPVFTATPAPTDMAFLNNILEYSPDETKVFNCTLAEFAAGVESCVAYVGIDTAATHIAASMNVTVIALYGSSLTRYWGPWPNGCENPAPFSKEKGIQHYGNITILQMDWECVPCNKESCRISTRDRPECLDAIKPEEVFRELILCLETRKDVL